MMKQFCKYVIEMLCLGTLIVGMSSCASFSLTPQPNNSISTLSAEDGQQLVLHMNNVLGQARNYRESGKANLNEGRFREARSDFEQARRVLDQEADRSVYYANRMSIQREKNVLLSSQFSGIMVQQRQIDRDIDYWMEILEREQREAEKYELMRRQSRAFLRPIPPETTIPRTLFFGSSSRECTRIYRDLDTVEDTIQRNISELLRKGNIFRQALLRANRLFPRVTAILAQEGVPEFLAYVALLESGYQPESRSRSGQAGLWQFSPSLARQYGLAVNASYDERLQIDASTRAFARYMFRLYQQYGNWIQAIDAFSPKPNYLARVIAANRIANDPRQYGFYLELYNMTGRYDLLQEGSRIQSFSDPQYCGPSSY